MSADFKDRRVNRLHSAILAFEALVFLLPVTVLWGFGFLVPIETSLMSSDGLLSIDFLLAMALAGASLLALWWALVVDIRWGKEKLIALHSGWFVVAGLGAIWSLLGIVVAMVLNFDQRQSLPMEYLVLGLFGAPALVPFLHVLLDRYRGRF